ncbi:Transposable element tcb2 transposase [Caligus rogercresseyi]|uniref:Transposable element tcb2 transposase n=1 Tax=Caligus rogercresseyi TaxID=217165 RepID=A0A7T8GX48_CALRO|nr:Transposable element tcb2 transposase [Caligus rogercresseyi]
MDRPGGTQSSSCCAQAPSCGHHQVAQVPRRTVYDITKKGRSTSPRVTGSARPQFVAGIKRSIKANPGTAHAHPRQEAVIKKDLGYKSYALKAKLVQSWLKKNVPNFWDFNTWPPNSPHLSPCDYYFNVASLKASIKSEMNKLDPAEVSMACGRFRRRLEDIFEAEGGHIE